MDEKAWSSIFLNLGEEAGILVTSLLKSGVTTHAVCDKQKDIYQKENIQ